MLEFKNVSRPYCEFGINTENICIFISHTFDNMLLLLLMLSVQLFIIVLDSSEHMGIFQYKDFLERTTLRKYLLGLSSFFYKHSKVPCIFVCSACALQLLPFSRSILEMTSRQWERRVSLPRCFGFQFVAMAAAATSCQSGSSCVHSFLCARSRGVTKRCVYITIYGVLWTMGTGLPPKSNKHH